MLAAVAMVLVGCTTLRVARQTVDWPVLVVIGAGIGVGKAVEASGLAAVGGRWRARTDRRRRARCGC